jgi:hypothetical protein
MGDACGFYAKTIPFFIRDFSIHEFCSGGGRGSGDNPLWIPGDDCTFPSPKFTLLKELGILRNRTIMSCKPQDCSKL